MVFTASEIDFDMANLSIAAQGNECCVSCDTCITIECRRCLAKYISVMSYESRKEAIMRIISEKKTSLFEVTCDEVFGELTSFIYDENPDYKSIYESLIKDNSIFEYVDYMTNLVIADNNKELLTIIQNYMEAWIQDFGNNNHDQYYEKCVEAFYDFFDSYINRLCNKLIEECNNVLLHAVLRSYDSDIYEIDITELMINSITLNRYDAFRFLYEYYIVEVCENTVNLYTIATLYKTILSHDRVDMFRMLYKKTKSYIGQRTITKLLSYNCNQECSKAYSIGLLRYRR